jgi:hypothetical protein
MKHAAVFAFLGVAFIYLGTTAGWPGLLLAWLGANFLVTAIGHAGLGPLIYGKDCRGRLRWWGRIAHLPFLLATWGVWHARRLVAQESPYDEITDELVAGRRLLPHERPDSIRNWVDLTAEFEEPRQITNDTNYVCVPTLDGGVPRLEDLMAALGHLEPGRTYVHCAQGYGRTALFALAFLAARGMAADFGKGMRILRERRPGVSLSARQERFARTELPWQHRQ